MTLHTGIFVGADPDGDGSDGAQPIDSRLALAGLLSGTGILKGGAVTGSTSGPDLQYVIAAGVFVTARGAAATDGVYLFANDAPLTVDSGSPAPASGSRWDLIWVRAKNAYDGGFGDSDSLPAAGVTVGSAGSTPTKPYSQVPAGALVLAEADVPANATDASGASISMVAAMSAPTRGSYGYSGWQQSALYTAYSGGGFGSLNFVREGPWVNVVGSITPASGHTWPSDATLTAVGKLPVAPGAKDFYPWALVRVPCAGFGASSPGWGYLHIDTTSGLIQVIINGALQSSTSTLYVNTSYRAA